MVTIPLIGTYTALPLLAEAKGAVLLTGLLGAIVQDIEAGAASQTALRHHYGERLRDLAPVMTDIATRHPVLRDPIALITRLAECRNTRTGNVVPPIDLRSAAASVYSRMRFGLVQQDEFLVEGVIKTWTLVETLGESVPRPAHVEPAYGRLSAELQDELKAIAQKLVGERRGQKHLGSCLSQSAFLLRAAAIDWIVGTLRETIEPARITREETAGPVLHNVSVACQKLAELLDWFCYVPLPFCHDFFQMLLRDPWMKAQGGMSYLREIVELVNRCGGTSFYIGTELRSKSKSQGSKDWIWHIKRLIPDQGLKKRMEEIIPDVYTRELIAKHSAAPPWLFFSHYGLREALVTALVSLYPYDKEGLSIGETEMRLRALAAIIELFLAEPPLLEQRHFFHALAKRGVIPYPQQLTLVAAINKFTGQKYRLRYCRDIFIERTGETSARRDYINARRRVGRKPHKKRRSGKTVRPALMQTRTPPAPHKPSATSVHRHTPSPPPLPLRGGGNGAASSRRPIEYHFTVREPKVFFNIGDVLVYPGVGVGTITAIETRHLGEHEYQVYVLEGPGMIGKAAIPLGSAATLSLRPPVQKTEVPAVFATLRAKPQALLGTNNMSKVIKFLNDRIRSGSVLELAAVLRDLSVRDTEVSGFSLWRWRLIDFTLHNLAAELSVVLERPFEELQQEIREILHQGNAHTPKSSRKRRSTHPRPEGQVVRGRIAISDAKAIS